MAGEKRKKRKKKESVRAVDRVKEERLSREKIRLRSIQGLGLFFALFFLPMIYLLVI